MRLHIGKSKKIAKLVDAEDNQCFDNSVEALLRFGPQNPALTYVEGVYVIQDSHPFPRPHGWLITDRWILDPTWVLHRRPHLTAVYEPIYTYTLRDVCELAEKYQQRCTLPLVHMNEEQFEGWISQLRRYMEQYGVDSEHIERVISHWQEIHAQ